MEEQKKTRLIKLGLLDKNTRLVQDSHAYIIQEFIKKTEEWKSIYWYSGLPNAIRGYVKLLTKKHGKKALKTPILDLLDMLASLEKAVKEVGNRLSKEWNVENVQ